MKIHQTMKDLLKELKNKRKQDNKTFGPLLNKIKHNKEWTEYIKHKTIFLDNVYVNIPLAQRFYHLWFSIDNIETCSVCKKPLQFNKYGRFSVDRIKLHSNYIQTCTSVKCLIETEKLKGTRTGKGYASLIIKISKNEMLHKDIIKETGFLDKYYKNISISQRFYHIYFGIELEKCPHCNGYRKFSYKNQFSINQTGHRETNYQKSCGNKECSILANVACSKNGLIEKHGVDNIWDIPGHRENFEKTMMEKYGTKYMFGSKHFKEKTLEKIEKDWDGLHPTKHKEVQDKKKETNIEIYGHGCALQNPEIYEKHLKSCYNFKNYTLPNGEIIQIQGYENLALDIILETKMTQLKDIIVDNIEIRKTLGDFKYTLDKKERIYFPDIYLKNLNLIIEVKSEYTYQNKLEENIKKKESVLNKGISFEFWILDKDSDLDKI